ncbi:hypothetical protein FSP39_021429 [Pinctada imbricata]|uniref:Fibrinogen C-terminal domain-containing protein n=1 Tax=Pinctada imbricata TaxID=66713 RepID=A0AA88YPB8_PINIB|nr:hypothetical protein FSP39_021429 [Pinctada imbricata]
MSTANGIGFTTYDADNDIQPNVNCAVAHSGAWWHSDCGNTNLNGDYSFDDGYGVKWIVDKNGNTMRENIMKFKCV